MSRANDIPEFKVRPLRSIKDCEMLHTQLTVYRSLVMMYMHNMDVLRCNQESVLKSLSDIVTVYTIDAMKFLKGCLDEVQVLFQEKSYILRVEVDSKVERLYWEFDEEHKLADKLFREIVDKLV
jgi:hypothetical protein